MNTHAQHIVNTVEVERPKIIDETVQKTIIQDKINQVTQHFEVPLSQFNDKVVDNPVVAQRQIYMVLTVQKSIEIPQLQVTDQVVDVPVVVVAQVPQVHVEKKTVEIIKLQPVVQVPRVLVVEKTVQDFHLNVYRETLRQNKMLRVVKINLAKKKCLVMLAEIAEKKDDDYKKSYEQFDKCLSLEIHEAKLLRFNTSKSGVEQISFEEYVDRMKEGQNDIYCITDESIAVVSSSSFRENLCRKGYEVLYVADPVDEFAVQQSKECDRMKAMTKEDFDLLCCQRSGSKRQRRSSQHQSAEQQPAKQAAKEREEGERVNGEEERTDVRKSEEKVVREGEKKKGGKEQGRKKKEKGRKGQRGRGQEGRKKEEREVEEGGGELVEKDVTGWTEVTRNKRKKMVQMFVKVDGMKTVAMEVSPEDKVQKILNITSKSDRNVYVMSGGRILKGSDKLKSCEVRDGSTVEVTSRMRGGGKHKDKKGKEEKKKQVAQLDDGMCAMACEQMRQVMETLKTLADNSTGEDKTRVVENVEELRKAIIGLRKRARGEELQRVAELEESLKKLEEEMLLWSVEEQEQRRQEEQRRQGEQEERRRDVCDCV